MSAYALLGVGGIVVALAIALWLGMRASKAAGRAEAERDQETANADAMERAASIEDRVRAAGADAGREWLHERYKRGGR